MSLKTLFSTGHRVPLASRSHCAPRATAPNIAIVAKTTAGVDLAKSTLD